MERIERKLTELRNVNNIQQINWEQAASQIAETFRISHCSSSKFNECVWQLIREWRYYDVLKLTKHYFDHYVWWKSSVIVVENLLHAWILGVVKRTHRYEELMQAEFLDALCRALKLECDDVITILKNMTSY